MFVISVRLVVTSAKRSCWLMMQWNPLLLKKEKPYLGYKIPWNDIKPIKNLLVDATNAHQSTLCVVFNVLLLSHQYNPERENLVKVLRRVTMPDRTVIVTMVDEAWARTGSILDVFLQSFKVGEGTQRFLNHLVIITTDAQAFEYCNSLHPHCIHPSIFPQFFGFNTQSTANPDHSMFSWRRNYVLFKVLELGYNIIFTVWF